jgi:hypothetical protein
MQHITLDDRTRAFLSAIWRGGRWSYFWTADEQKTYTNEQGEQEPVKRSYWFPVGKTPQPPKKPTAHMYFCVNPSTEKRSQVQRAIMANIASIATLFAEWDALDWGSKEAILAHIETLPRMPSVLIDSGGGYHAYWLLDEPFIIDSDERRFLAKDYSRRWVRACEGDDVKDLTRVLRLPGSRNIKPKYAPDYPLVEYVYCDLERRYSLADLVSILPADQDDEVAQQAPRRDTSQRAALNGQGSIIDLYNANVTVESRLEAANYLRRGKRYSAPNADKSTNSSVVILDDNCSYHWDTGDPLADEHKHSAFDVYCHYEHGGNAKAAVKAYMLETGHIQEPDFVNGVACCPIHHVKLPRAANGNGYKCHQKDGAEWCSYFWKGEGYVMPAENKTTTNTTTTTTPLPRATTATLRSYLTESEIDSAIRPPTFLVKNYIALGEVTVVYGPSDSGKSTIVVDMVCRTNQHFKTMYIAGEDASGVKVKRGAWMSHHRRGTQGNFLVRANSIDLDNDQEVDDLIAEIKAAECMAVIFDTLSQCSGGADENTGMKPVMANLQHIAHATGAAVVAIHHTGKSGEYRGDSKIKANAYGFIKIIQEDDVIKMECDRIKNTAPFKPRYFRFLTVDSGYRDHEGESITAPVILPAQKVMRSDSLTRAQAKLLEMLINSIDGMQTTILQNNSELKGNAFYSPLRVLRERGFVRKKGEKPTDPLIATDAGKTAYALETGNPDAASGAVTGFDDTFEINQKVTTITIGSFSEDCSYQAPDTLANYHTPIGYDGADMPQQDAVSDEELPELPENYFDSGSSDQTTSYHTHSLEENVVGSSDGSSKEESNEQPLFDDDIPIAQASSVHVPTEAERNAPASELDFVPAGKRTILTLYLRSNKDSDQDRARELCGTYDIDYETALSEVRAMAI